MSQFFGIETVAALIARLGFEGVTILDWSTGSGATYQAGKQIVLRIPFFEGFLGVFYIKVIFGWIEFHQTSGGGFTYKTLAWADAFTGEMYSFVASQTESTYGSVYANIYSSNFSDSGVRLYHSTPNAVQRFSFLAVGSDLA